MSFHDLRQRYLAASADLLQESSPSTAAALCKQLQNLSTTDTVHLRQQIPGVCPACGHCNMTTRTVWPKLKLNPRGKSGNSKSHQVVPIVTVLTQQCNTCHRVMRHRLQSPPKRRAQLSVAQPAASDTRMVLTPVGGNEKDMIKDTTTTTTAKKRAKAKKEGLLALLEKNKQPQNSTIGFNLMDFMRTA